MAAETHLALALRALDDRDAVPVLADALLEDEWDVPEVWALLHRKQPFNYDEMIDDLDAWREAALSVPDRRLPIAVVAYALFGAWPTRWPLAQANARRVHDQWITEFSGRWNPFTHQFEPPTGPVVRIEQIQRLLDMGYITTEDAVRMLGEIGQSTETGSNG